MQSNLKNKEARLKELSNEGTKIGLLIQIEKGPYQTEFDNVIESFKVKRQIYHSGTLVRNDVDKLFGDNSRQSIPKLANVFKPSKAALADGAMQWFSSFTQKQKIKCLLKTFSLIYELMMVSRPLCKHEIAKLCVRCYSFGNWFPVNFPSESLIRNFHMMVMKICKCPKQGKSTALDM